MESQKTSTRWNNRQESNNRINAEELSEGEEVFQLYKMNHSTTIPIIVDLSINGTPTQMEVDTGASLSIVSENIFDYILSGDKNINVKPSCAKLKTYTGELINPVGTATVRVMYKGQSAKLPLMIVPGDGPSLLGRNSLNDIKLDWHSLFRTSEENYPEIMRKLDIILDQNKNIFQPGLGKMKNTKIKIELKPDVKLKYCKACPVPYALRNKIDNELDRLVKENILKPVEFSEWATPIVPVLKSDGSVRLCGDFKQTVNKAAKCDNYPIPKTEDLFASLGGGDKFTKLDLSNAYLQLELEEESQELTNLKYT